MTPNGSRGLVSLVGAGPGDRALLTLGAAERLRVAELVLYAALVSPEVIELASRAQCFSVGKRAGRRSVPQNTIIRVMIRAARRGRHVVRLKGGDPFVLGRGGEAGLALRAAGIPFEVVQGVRAAIAAPALAGIPVTHRGLASGFVVVSGHDESSYAPILESLAPASATVVVLMGLTQRRTIARCLLDRGWPPDTSVAIASDAATPVAHTWTGSLEQLGRTASPHPEDATGTIIIGAVVDLATALASPPATDAAQAAEGKG